MLWVMSGGRPASLEAGRWCSCWDVHASQTPRMSRRPGTNTPSLIVTVTVAFLHLTDPQILISSVALGEDS